ncbi:MAG TPA: AMP-binding protein, partial [Kiloniellales bacterium]|nr:AMP-binding protein [Kiloniellales bacterium]
MPSRPGPGENAVNRLSARDGTLRRVVDALPGFGDSPAVLTLSGEQTTHLSYRALSDQIARLGAGLIERGLEKGGRVAILAPNGPAWIAVCLAVVDAGGIVVPIDSALDEDSLRHVLADSAPRLAFVGTEERERVESLLPQGCRMIALDGEDDSPDWQSVMNAEPAERPALEPEDPAVLFYTSGTTGPPKGVPLSHRNLLFELHGLLDIGLMAPGERLLLPLPLHHVYPFVVGMLASLIYGVGIVLPQSMTGPHIVQAIRACDVATVIGVPRLYDALLSGVIARVEESGWAPRLLFRGLLRISRSARRRLGLRLGSRLFRALHRRIGPRLRLLASGGAALDEDLAWSLEALGWTVATGYGLTETAPLLTIVAPGDTRFDTAGKPIPGVEVRIAPLESGDTEPEADESDS